MAAPARSADVIVAGLGAMGSATAFHLARRGARVLGLDRYTPPHSLGSTHGGTRVIRETAFEHPRYVALARRAYDCWREIEKATGAALLRITGVLFLGPAGGRLVSASRASGRSHGVECEDLTADEVRRRFPQFRSDAGMVGLLEPHAGVLAAERSIEACLEYARARGAELRLEEPLERWEASGDGVAVTTPKGRYTAGRLVIATGPWMQAVLEEVGVPVWVERVLMHWFAPAARPETLEAPPCPVSLWECPSDVLFAAFPLADGAVKIAVHHHGARTSPEAVNRTVSAEEIAAASALIRRYIPDAAGAHARSAVCLYTNTPDGDFVLDFHPKHPEVVLASPCSGIGFKFSSVIGEILADLATEGRSRLDLSPFRIGRPLRTR